MAKTISQKLNDGSKENAENGCIEWQKGVDGFGYGKIRDGARARAAHRISYEINVGPIPDGMCVLHKCDNPKCVNPEHLFIGTHQDNSDDKISKGRHPHGESHPMFGRKGVNNPKFGKKYKHKPRTRFFSDDDIREIRASYANGGVTQLEIAKKFHVHRVSICMIVNRKNYSDVE